MSHTCTAIGLMSGTSLDGIDVALIETDGQDAVKPLDFLSIPYTDADRAVIRAAYGKKDRTCPEALGAEDLSTRLHIDAVKALLARTDRKVDLIGYHGQTTYHAPADKITIQLGDGARMARELGIPVVYDMRANDVALGGQGAPLAPLYHRARAKAAGLPFPCVILNIGGVSNVTYMDDNDILAFDCGPGNALLDDWMQKRIGARFDADGKLAASGRPNLKLLSAWLDQPYFKRVPPKSLDRDEWDIAVLGPLSIGAADLSDADGAAMLLAFSGEGIVRSLQFMKLPPLAWYVAGGGRHNKALMDYLSARLPHVQSVDALNWNGDATEAECFAYLAVRSTLDLPLSLPTTTGAPAPATGGKLANP